MSTSNGHVRRRARAAGSVAAAVITSVALSSCFALPGGPKAVEFDGVQSATIQIQAQGTFVDPGTTAASESAGRGSGFLIDPSGIAVTNNHVVVGAGTLTVWLGGDTGEEYNATVLGASECLDLAVIQLEDGEYPFMAWREGEIKNALDVYSAGFPLGDPEFTLTKGIVSKADTSIPNEWASLEHIIEHDARIRGGNSGGPLIDEDGRVVGVNYAGMDELDYNYAIHRDEVLPVLDRLKEGEPVLSLGVNAVALSPSEDGAPQGVWVSSVQAGGPADEAGIEPGDVLVDMAGITLAADGSLEEYCEVIRTQGTGATIDVTVYRPSTDEVWAGQFNGDELELVSGGGGGQEEPVGSFVTVSDDAGVVSVDVPDTWFDVDGGAYTDEVGYSWNSVTASPDLEAFNGTWDVPGVSVATSLDAVGTDPALILEQEANGVASGCQLDDSSAYDDGYYQGEFAYWTDCGGAGTDYAVIAATDADQTHFVIVKAQLVSDLDKTTVLDSITASFIGRY